MARGRHLPASKMKILFRPPYRKTTVMLLKMLVLEANYKKNPGSFPRRPRQIFITQSQILAARVQEYYRGIHASVDSSIAGSGEHLLTTTFHGDKVMFPDQNEFGLPIGMPRCFNELQDDHFPLFLSYDQVC